MWTEELSDNCTTLGYLRVPDNCKMFLCQGIEMDSIHYHMQLPALLCSRSIYCINNHGAQATLGSCYAAAFQYAVDIRDSKVYLRKVTIYTQAMTMYIEMNSLYHETAPNPRFFFYLAQPSSPQTGPPGGVYGLVAEMSRYSKKICTSCYQHLGPAVTGTEKNKRLKEHVRKWCHLAGKHPAKRSLLAM